MNPQDTAATALFPPGFVALMEQIAAKQAKPAKKRRGLLADVESALALGKTPPRLEFASTANYTYNHHAEMIWAMWQARDVQGLLEYQMTGKNTYARAVERYRTLLLANLQKGS